MSSNEEYLDSLLKSVTAKEQAGGVSGTGKSASEGVSSVDLEKMLASEESVEAGAGYDEDYMEEEKAFSDPGSLFFAGDEDEEGFEDSFLAIEDIPEDDDSVMVNDGEDADAESNDIEEEMTAKAGSMEEDIIAVADSMEEDVIAEADNMEEDSIAATDNREEDIMAEADNMEEDIMAEADNMEEDVMTAADNMEEDVIAAADGMEEDVIAATDSMEEDSIASVGSEEEDLIAAADSMEEDIIAMADSVEEMHDNAVFEDENFKEISDLLASSGDGDDDMFAMLEGVGTQEENMGIDIGFFDEEENNEEPVEETKKERKKREKKKRNKRNKKKDAEEQAVEAEEGFDTEEGAEELVSVGEVEKKPGIFKRFIDFLMEEDDDEEETGKVRIPISDDDDLFVGEETSENDTILQELSQEDAAKKSKKDDKKKKKKGKKGKNVEEDSEADEEELEEKDDKKKKKAKKEKKKKEKPIEEIIPEAPGKKISIKKIEVTVVFCLTILAAILLAVNLIPPTLEKSRARDAYYAKDYEKVMEGFYGEELSDSDSIMYNRAYIILRLQRKIDGYNNYMRMGKETEALNQLIEGVVRYNEIYADAEKYNVTAEIDEMYQTIEDALENRYGISTTVAEGLYAMEDNLAYTLKLESIINGTEYVAPEYDETGEAETETAEE